MEKSKLKINIRIHEIDDLIEYYDDILLNRTTNYETIKYIKNEKNLIIHERNKLLDELDAIRLREMEKNNARS